MNNNDNSNGYWMPEIQKDWKNLQYAPYEIRNNKKIVLIAINKSYGIALEFASPELRNDKDVVTAAVNKSLGGINDYYGEALQYASSELQMDEHFILDIIVRHIDALLFVKPGLQNNKEFIMQVVQLRPYALKYTPQHLQNDKEVVMAAIENDKLCWALQYASPTLQNDKQVVLAAIKQHRDAIKFASDGLKRDRDVLIAAGMFDEYHDAVRQGKDVRKIVFSTRFSLTPTTHSLATKFTSLLKQHEYIENGNFKIYAPNAFDKKTCDPEWTRYDWPCRGTKDTCKFDDRFKTGHPTDESCWRYSFRSQLEEAKATGGFMLQLIEADKWQVGEPQKLGNGQRIELDMAQTVGTKVFQVYRPTNDTMNDAERYELPFYKKHIDIVMDEISRWYSNGCQDDMSVTVIRP